MHRGTYRVTVAADIKAYNIYYILSVILGDFFIKTKIIKLELKWWCLLQRTSKWWRNSSLNSSRKYLIDKVGLRDKRLKRSYWLTTSTLSLFFFICEPESSQAEERFPERSEKSVRGLSYGGALQLRWLWRWLCKKISPSGLGPFLGCGQHQPCIEQLHLQIRLSDIQAYM